MNTTLRPYIFFDGNCREAMNFYKECLGGDLQMMTYQEAQQHPDIPEAKSRLIHATLTRGDFSLMASDFPQGGPKVGDNINLCLNCSSLEEIEKSFKALSEKGQVKQALNDTFWGGRLGMLKDRFGFHWMLIFEKPKAKN